MRVPQRLWAALLFAALGLLALAFSGLLDWITSVLFLVLEFLAGFFRPRSEHRKKPRPRHRSRVLAGASAHMRDRARRSAFRKTRPRRAPAGAEADVPEAPASLGPRTRVLVPLSADRPELITFALEECLDRQAELLLLFLRPLAVTPMGPNPRLTLAEDDRARTLFERVAAEARDAGVPHRTFYEPTRDMPATILDVARAHDADVVLMEATRRNLLWRALIGDEIQAVLMHLPEHVNLLIHTP